MICMATASRASRILKSRRDSNFFIVTSKQYGSSHALDGRFLNENFMIFQRETN